MKKILLSLSLLLILITAFTPQQKERTYTLTVPEHLAFTVYHLLIGDAEQRLTVSQYKELMPQVTDKVATQIMAQAQKFQTEDSIANAKKDTTKQKK